jgi:hypothetical protein
MDGGSTHRLRSNLNHSVNQPNSLLHAREAKPSALHCGFCIKTCTKIADGEVNLSRASPTIVLRSALPHYASWRCAGLLVELGIEKEKDRLARK